MIKKDPLEVILMQLQIFQLERLIIFAQSNSESSLDINKKMES